MGKGDSYRTVVKTTYDNNYEMIFGRTIIGSKNKWMWDRGYEVWRWMNMDIFEYDENKYELRDHEDKLIGTFVSFEKAAIIAEAREINSLPAR